MKYYRVEYSIDNGKTWKRASLPRFKELEKAKIAMRLVKSGVEKDVKMRVVESLK